MIVDNVSLPETPDLRLKNVCVEMESLFIYRLLKEMRASIPKSGFTGKSEEIYTSISDIHLSKELAVRGMGLSGLLFAQLSKQREYMKNMGGKQEKFG